MLKHNLTNNINKYKEYHHTASVKKICVPQKKIIRSDEWLIYCKLQITLCVKKRTKPRPIPTLDLAQPWPVRSPAQAKAVGPALAWPWGKT